MVSEIFHQIYNIPGLDLQQVVSEHFLGHKSGDFFYFYFLHGFGGGELQVTYLRFCERSVEFNCISVFLVREYPNSKKKSVESESG